MTVLLWLLALVALTGALLFGLANHWANTPYGRIKPIFALAFKLAPILDPGAKGRVIGAASMDTPEQIARVRADFKKNTAGLSKPIAFDGTIEDRRLAGGPGGDLPVRIYVPDGPGPFPLLVYFHGGGWVVGDPDYTDVTTRILALRTPAVVVSVDYRMAPEHPFPAAPDDCEFAVNWCFENAESLGARPGPVAVAGDSAGGNLAAVVALRDVAKRMNRIGLQVLIYPCVDVARADRPSHVAFGEGFGLSRLDLEDCKRCYVPPGTDPRNPDLSPIYAKSLAGLARACILTAGFDVLRDEGIAYAEALRKAGVEVVHTNDPSLPHGFITMTRICSEAEKHLASISTELRNMLSAPHRQDETRGAGGSPSGSLGSGGRAGRNGLREGSTTWAS
jgi:acetyl esterase